MARRPVVTHRRDKALDLVLAVGCSYLLVLVSLPLLIGYYGPALTVFFYIGPYVALGELIYNAFASEPVETFGPLWHVVPVIFAATGFMYAGWRAVNRRLRVLLFTATATGWAFCGFYCLLFAGALNG